MRKNRLLAGLGRVFLLCVPLLAVLAVSEITLWAMGFIPYGTILHPRPIVWNYDEAQDPCRADSLDEALLRARIQSPVCKGDPDLGFVSYGNAQGFNDSKDFERVDTSREKFMLLGDSFTEGHSVARGAAWTDLLQKAYAEKGPLFFNTGISGYAQKNQLAVLKKFHGSIRPDAVFLLFCSGNDFRDNLFPVDFQFTTAEAGCITAKYKLEKSPDGGTRAVPYSPEELRQFLRGLMECVETNRHPRAAYYAGLVKRTIRKYFFFSNRTGSVLWTAASRLRRKRVYSALELAGTQVRPEDESYRTTRELLREMRDFLKQRGTPMYAGVIPDPGLTFGFGPTQNELMAHRVLEELGIPVLPLRPYFSNSDYASRWPVMYDGHWNARGNQKMFKAFRDCLDRRPGKRRGDFCVGS